MDETTGEQLPSHQVPNRWRSPAQVDAVGKAWSKVLTNVAVILAEVFVFVLVLVVVRLNPDSSRELVADLLRVLSELLAAAKLGKGT